MFSLHCNFCLTCYHKTFYNSHGQQTHTIISLKEFAYVNSVLQNLMDHADEAL